MGDANEQKTNEGSGQQAIDTTKFVPKDEHEKAVATSKTEIERLRQELDEAKLSMLDPEYIAYKEEKKRIGGDIRSKEKEAADAAKSGDKEELSDLRKEIAILRQRQEEVSAVLELQHVEKKYKDFDEHRDDIRAFLEKASTPFTIEQAYLIVKAQKGSTAEKSQEDKTVEARSSREKPGAGVPGGSAEPVSYKDKRTAADAAWDSIVGAGRDTL